MKKEKPVEIKKPLAKKKIISKNNPIKISKVPLKKIPPKKTSPVKKAVIKKPLIKETKKILVKKEILIPKKEIVPKQNILELIRDKDLIESANHINQKNPKIFLVHSNFSDKNSAEIFIKEKIKDFLEGQRKDLSDKISSLRKRGVDTGIENFYLMAIPLKLKLFLSNYNLDDLTKLESKMEKLSQQVSKLETENPLPIKT